MKKSGIWLAVVAALVIIVAVIYVVTHKSNPTTPASTNTSTSTSGTQVNNAVVSTKSNSSTGNYLANPQGSALYTIGSGSAGVTGCSGSCLSAWPPYQDTGSTTGLPANISTIKRSDNGETQYTYKGMPLYTFSSDSAGQVTGDGVSGFSVAKP